MAARRLVRRRGRGFELRLDAAERDLLGTVIGELRGLLLAENQASDPAIARLFPPAYPDDLLQNLDFERGAGNRLLAERLAALDAVEAALGSARVSQDELLALIRTVNDLRLVYGTRLDVTQESRPGDFGRDPERATYQLYVWLSWLVEDCVDAVGVARPPEEGASDTT